MGLRKGELPKQSAGYTINKAALADVVPASRHLSTLRNRTVTPKRINRRYQCPPCLGTDQEITVKRTMSAPALTKTELIRELRGWDGEPYTAYQALGTKAYDCGEYRIHFMHIQGSPGAFPASVVHLETGIFEMGLDDAFLSTSPRRLATADFLLRAFGKAVDAHAKQNRGAQGSGSFQPIDMPPQVLQRNLVHFDGAIQRITFHISLPGSVNNRILADQAIEMLDTELPAIFQSLRADVGSGTALQHHCDVVEDMVDLQHRLAQYNLVAFVGDGAILPRLSGDSLRPMTAGAVEFAAPDDLAVEVDLLHAGRVRGLGIHPGVNVVIGGAYHGKSTLLQALAKGVYPHIPGDGRERVVTHPDAFMLSAEEGRAVTDLDISGFVDHLPSQQSTRRFSSMNASGSTSQAAATVEAIQAGAKVLLIDEDTSAANFLARDKTMRQLLPEETITPLLDRVRELDRRYGIATVMVLGGSSAYLGAADRIMAMRHYSPVNMTGRVAQLNLPDPEEPSKPLILNDNRLVLAGNFDPGYDASRLGKRLQLRIKPLRLQPGILEYGNQQVNLTRLYALVDSLQTVAIGYALLQAGTRFDHNKHSPSGLAAALDDLIEEEGLGTLLPDRHAHLALARPRRLELAAAINRLRDLRVH